MVSRGKISITENELKLYQKKAFQEVFGYPFCLAQALSLVNKRQDSRVQVIKKAIRSVQDKGLLKFSHLYHAHHSY